MPMKHQGTARKPRLVVQHSLVHLEAWMTQRLSAMPEDTLTSMLQLTLRPIGTPLVKLREDWEHVPRSLLSSRHSDTSIWTLTCNVSTEGQEVRQEIRQTSTSWPRGTRRLSMPIQQGTSSQSHGSVESGSTRTANARVWCTSDLLRGQTVVKRSRLSTTWGNGGQLLRRPITGQCVRPKTSDQTHGQTRRSNAIASQSHNTNQANVEMKEKTVYVMVGSCLESNKIQMIQLKMLSTKMPLNNHLLLMMQIELQVFHAQPRALRMLILFQRVKNNVSAMKTSFLLTLLVFHRLKISGDHNWSKCKWKLFIKPLIKLYQKLRMMKLLMLQLLHLKWTSKTRMMKKVRALVLSVPSRKLSKKLKWRRKRFNLTN